MAEEERGGGHDERAERERREPAGEWDDAGAPRPEPGFLGDGGGPLAPEPASAGMAEGPANMPAPPSLLARRVWPVARVLLVSILALVVMPLLVAVVLAAASGLAGWRLAGPSSEPGLDMAVAGSVILPLGLAVTLLAWRFWERRPLAAMLLDRGPRAARALILGVAVGVAELAVVLGVLGVAGAVRVVWNPVFLEGVGVMALGWLFASVIAGPLFEEVLDRGYWYQNVARAWGVPAAVVVNAALFSGLHMGNPNASWMAALNIGLIGIAFTLGMLLARSLWFPIGWHASWNFTQFFVAGLPNSGLAPAEMGLGGATLLVSVPSGPAWLTGGDFGVEASAVATAASLLAIAVLALLLARRRAGSQAGDTVAEISPR